MRKFTIFRHRTSKNLWFGVFFMLLCCGTSGQAQRKLISASFSNEPLDQVLRTLEGLDQYRFVFNYSETDGYRVTQTLSGVDMNTALSRVLTGLPFTYSMEGTRVTVRKSAAAETAPASPLGRTDRIEVSGRVTDGSGLPLVGVSIADRSSGRGTVTDAQGHYAVLVQPGSILTFSYMGYHTRQIPVGTPDAGRTILNVVMVIEDQEIDEVVVDGYRTISRERVGGAYTIITEQELSRKPVSNISSALTGMVPGMATTVSTIDGQNRFVIRGQGTLAQNSSTADNRIDTDPLIVVDGFPIQGFTSNNFGADGIRNSMDPFATINPNDVETITVLRDAAATSIYGARAANGVIVITTKKGKSGKPNISVSGHVSISSKPDLGYAFNMADTKSTFWYMENLRQYYSGYQSSWYNPYNYPSEADYVYINDVAALMLEHEMGHITQTEFDRRKSEMLANDGKWKKDLGKLVYRNAVTQQYNLSIRGGSEQMNYSFSAAYDKEDTCQQGNDNQRIMLNLTNQFKLSGRLTLDLGINTGFSQQTNNDVPLTALKNSISPWHRIVDDQGNYSHISANSYATGATDNTLSTAATIYYPILMSEYEGKTPASWFYNPVQDSKYIDNTSDRFTTRIHAALNYRVLQNLQVRLSGQYERNQYKSHMYYKPESYLVRNYYNLYSTYNEATGLYDSYFDTGGGNFTDKGNQYEDYNLRAQADYSGSFGLHDVVLSAGTEVTASTQENNATLWRYGYNENTNSVLSTTDYINYYTNIFGNQVRMPYKAPGNLYTYEDRYFSAYLNAAYTYRAKYTLTASARTDASNFQAKDTRDKFSPFWSVAGVWLISGEEFLVDVPWIDLLKFRTSIGEAGFAAGKYRTSSVTTVSTSSGSIQYSNNEPYNGISARGNSSLTWEKSRTFDIGLDFRLW
ncbi:MAG: SusC/RagA family TonB-linked outer membrane protein [Rikenellaceae bacterium]|nr:SusC/RagA family TonB-linked outer membrane protein [Rikenellaceae bacterium]